MSRQALIGVRAGDFAMAASELTGPGRVAGQDRVGDRGVFRPAAAVEAGVLQRDHDAAADVSPLLAGDLYQDRITRGLRHEGVERHVPPDKGRQIAAISGGLPGLEHRREGIANSCPFGSRRCRQFIQRRSHREDGPQMLGIDGGHLQTTTGRVAHKALLLQKGQGMADRLT